jgi:rod shape determining protein RodA
VTRILKNDWITLSLAFVITIAGIISIISSEGGFTSGLPGIASKQLKFLGVGLILYFIFSFIDYRVFKKIAIPAYFLILIMLISVLVVGAVRGGAERWILIGSYQFQPSEHSKLLIVIVLSRVFTRMRGLFSDRTVFFTSLAIILPVVLLIAIEPDLGTAMIFLLLFLVMSFISPINWRIPVTFVLILVLLVPATWPLMREYQKNRIQSFINPASDPLGKGYQSNQSKIAIGSGGFTGKGLFKGTQNKLDFIPSQSTDFIFSIPGEEGGFLVSALIVALYAFLLLHLGMVASGITDPFGNLIVWGICATLFLQTFVNIGMTMGIMPVTGIPLPLMSYGINSLLINYLSLGIANSVYRHSSNPD